MGVRCCIISSLKAVTDTPNRYKVARIGWVTLNFLAQAADVHRNRRGVAIKLVAPDLIEKLIAREHLAGMARHKPQQRELARGQIECFAAGADTVRGRIEE